MRTELTELPGIGPVRARKLLREFGSVAGVRRAHLDALTRAVGRKAAQTVAKRYRPTSGGGGDS